MRKKLMHVIASKPELLINLNTSVLKLSKLAEHLIENDVVQVVRCKDCKHYSKDGCWCDRNSHFDDTDVFFMNWNDFGEDDFCSYGERKDDA